jgi:hypothetical protein
VNDAATFNWSAGTLSGNVSTLINASGTMNIPGIGGTATLNNNASISTLGRII